ncbi:hypothetical protein [Vibrio phage D4]|nr:hypothetical protein [Vibrio phage D4]
MTPQEKIENSLNTMTADQLFELMRELNDKEDHASIVLLELVTDRYMAIVPEETFLQAMNILEAALV